ncbi:MAG: hypothetical protein ACUVUD_02955 [bacterium]
MSALIFRREMNLWERLATIDRRIIYTILGLIVIIPLILKPKIAVRVSEPVHAAYDAIEKLPPASVVMISIDFDPSSAPEVQPMLVALLRHCFKKNLKVILTGQLALGLPLGEIALNQVASEYNKVYGKDYVNIGYRPGYAAMMVGIGREIRNFFKTDFRGISLDSFEFMRRVHNYHDIALLVSLAHGAVADAWIQYAGARFKQKIVVGCTGVNAPGMFQYYSAHQIEGIIGGLQGASEYETLVEKTGAATLGMPAQSAAHGLLIFILIIGNIAFLVSRKKKRG